jgi:hypothetical protein
MCAQKSATRASGIWHMYLYAEEHELGTPLGTNASRNLALVLVSASLPTLLLAL